MPGLFLIRKTGGGHRRYGPEDVARFATIRRLTETDSLPLAQVRRVLSSRGDYEPLREEVERLRAAQQEDAWKVAELSRKIAALEEKVEKLGAAKKGWFGKG
jgi:DNA-binding transcriptional MerR regulator